MNLLWLQLLTSLLCRVHLSGLRLSISFRLLVLPVAEVLARLRSGRRLRVELLVFLVVRLPQRLVIELDHLLFNIEGLLRRFWRYLLRTRRFCRLLLGIQRLGRALMLALLLLVHKRLRRLAHLYGLCRRLHHRALPERPHLVIVCKSMVLILPLIIIRLILAVAIVHISLMLILLLELVPSAFVVLLGEARLLLVLLLLFLILIDVLILKFCHIIQIGI